MEILYVVKGEEGLTELALQDDWSFYLWVLWEDVVNQSLVPGPECPATTTNP